MGRPETVTERLGNDPIAALKRLERQGGELVTDEIAAAMLEHPEPVVRRFAAKLLAEKLDPVALPAFREALGDDEPYVVVRAANVLGANRDRASIDALVEALATSDDWYVRATCARALGEIPHRRALPALRSALHDRHRKVVKSAAYAISHIADPESATILRDAGDDPRVVSRRYVRKALRALRARFPALEGTP